MFIDDDLEEVLDVQETLARYEAELSEELTCKESSEALTSKATGRRKRTSFLDNSIRIRQLSTSEEQSLGSTRDLSRASIKSAAEESDHNYQRRRSSRCSHISIPIKLNDDNIALKEIDGYSFLDVIEETVQENKDNIFATWYKSDGKPADDYTFGELWEEARIISHYLRNELALKKGDRVVLCYNFGLHFFASFLGCLRAGVIAVLVYPPSIPLAKSLTKMNKVVCDCDAKLILTDSDVNLLQTADMLNPLSKSRHLWPKDIKYKDTKKLTSNNFMSFFNQRKKQKSETSDKNIISPEDTAFLQYTSGSTGDPKGVMVTFRALAANVSLLRAGFADMCKKNKLDGCSWLPQYHDLGLVVGNIVPFVSGWRMHMMSPLAFIQRPLLWLELMSRYKVDWSAAPNFAMKMVARKFVEFKKKSKNSDPIPGLDLSHIKIQVCAEPVQAETKTVFEGVFKEYGLQDDWFKAGYGLAEHVVGVSYIPELHLSSPREEDITSMVAVGSRETFHHSLLVKIVCPETCQEMDDGKTGELWVSGPSVAGGYFKKPELTETVFHAKLAGSNSDVHYLRTGDLAFFQNHMLYICGRQKDLIIVNGVNYYPQDIEYAAQDASPAVRPGCVAAFSSNDTGGNGDLEVVFEIRNSNISTAEEVARAVRLNISKSSGLTPTRVVAIKEKTICKTTSGKIQRRANRKALHDGQQKIICDIGKSKLSLKIAHGEIPPADLPTSSFPKAAVEAIRKIKADAAKLNSYFKELRLEQLPGVSEAWGSADKSTSTLQSMCEMTMQSLLQHYPSVVQFLHLLASHPEWVLGDGQKQLVEIVHCGFVMDWATQQLATNAGLLRAKLEGDIENEEKAMEIGQEPVDIPGDTSFFVKGNSTDRLFGQYDIFGWMKTRSIQRLTFRLLEALENGKGCIEVEGEDIDWATLNVLEATWLDQIMGRFDNASVGHWLCARSGHTVNVDGNSFNVTYEQEDYTRVYMTWNLAIMTAMPNAPFVLSKLLIPSVAAAPADRVFMFRLVSLYLAMQKSLDDYLQKRTEPNILSPLATQAFGCLNKRWAYSIDYNEDIDWTNPSTENPPELPTGKWFRRFEEWKEANECHKKSLPNLPNSGKLQHSNQCCPNKKACRGDCEDDFSEIIMNVLNVQLSSTNKDTTWDELGLTSIASAGLQNKLSARFSVELEIDYFNQYSTPALLEQHLLESCGSSFPTSAPALKRTSTRQISWCRMGLLQVIGAAILLFIFTLPVLPAWYMGKAFLSNGFVTAFQVNGNSIQWFWFPIVIPTWMIGLTVLVILCKWIVVGQYTEQEVLVQSIPYLCWWFVDRAVHIWEFWVGRFIKDTFLLWLFYSLMGAKIHISAELKAFVREFDLVEIGCKSSIKEHICCRKFTPWDEHDGPSLRFRKINVGSNTTVKGMMLPGATLGDSVILENCSVLDEGAQVPRGSRAVGNPAFSGGNATHVHSKCVWWKTIGALKLTWLLVELYLFFGALLISRLIWDSRLPAEFRYTPLIYWVFCIGSSSVLMLLLSIIFKWLLIGRCKPGPSTKSLFQSVADWTADYHYRVSISFLLPFTEHSRLWNAVFKLYGMKVDMFTKLLPQPFCPSNMDLVYLENSFISLISFEVDSCGLHQQISISNSNIGLSSQIEAGAKIDGKVIPPFSNVKGAVQGDEMKDTNITLSQLLLHEMLLLFIYGLFFGLMLVSLVPAYEIWTVFDHQNICRTVLVLPLVLLVQIVSWIITLFILQLIMFTRSDERNKPWNTPLYLVFHSANFYIQEWSHVYIIWGSPIMAHILRFLGANLKGRMLFCGNRACDYPYLCFGDKTIIDGSVINGHFGLLDGVTLGHCVVDGLVPQGCYYMSNSISPKNKVSRPFEAYGGPKQARTVDMV